LIDHDHNLLEVIKTNIEINDDVYKKKRCFQIQNFHWIQLNVHEVDNHIEIILAADGIFCFSYILFSISLIYLS